MRAMLCHETGSIDGLVPGEVADPLVKSPSMARRRPVLVTL